MSSYKHIFCLLFLLIISGCGFKPVYMNEGSSIGKKIFIAPIANRSGQILRNSLLKTLGNHEEQELTDYVLKVYLDEDFYDLGLLSDAAATLVRTTVKASYVLYERKTMKQVYSSEGKLIETYNIMQSPFATRSNEHDVRKRLLAMLAREISHKIICYVKNENRTSSN
jgi:LPS-assembly lipoprotein